MSDRITTIKQAQNLVKQFAERNHWKDEPSIDKFDHLHEELIEMSQHLRYKNLEERKKFVAENKNIFTDGIGDLFFGTCRLANQLGVNVEEAFNFVKDEILAKYNHTNPENNLVNQKNREAMKP
jgi:NTP pyrophosphatase (non-canonical NTP hydrolase)